MAKKKKPEVFGVLNSYTFWTNETLEMKIMIVVELKELWFSSIYTIRKL